MDADGFRVFFIFGLFSACSSVLLSWGCWNTDSQYSVLGELPPHRVRWLCAYSLCRPPYCSHLDQCEPPHVSLIHKLDYQHDVRYYDFFHFLWEFSLSMQAQTVPQRHSQRLQAPADVGEAATVRPASNMNASVTAAAPRTSSGSGRSQPSRSLNVCQRTSRSLPHPQGSR